MTQKQKMTVVQGLAGIGIATVLALAYSAYLSPTMILSLADLNLCF